MDETIITAPDELFTADQHAQLETAFSSLPANKRAAVLVLADLNGNARATLTAKLGDHWVMMANASYHLGDKRPAGYVGIEGSF